MQKLKKYISYLSWIIKIISSVPLTVNNSII